MSKENSEQPENNESKKSKKVKLPEQNYKPIEFDENGLHFEDGRDIKALEMISSGSLNLDVLTNGGFTFGIINLIGQPGIGKTVLALIMAGNFQKFFNYENVVVIHWLTEGRFNIKLASMAPNLKMESPTQKDENGNPLSIFKKVYPKSAEQMYDYMLKSVQNDKTHFFHIIDSADGLKSLNDLGKNFEEGEKVAVIAKLNSQFCRDSSMYFNMNKHVCLVCHQQRDKISTGHSRVSGSGKAVSSGKALPHYSNLKINFSDLWSELLINEDPNDGKSKVIGHTMEAKLEKVSTSGASNQKVPIPFIYNHGIDLVREVRDLAEANGLIKKSGNTYSYDDEKLGIGEKQLLKSLKDNPKLVETLEKEIRKLAGI